MKLILKQEIVKEAKEALKECVETFNVNVNHLLDDFTLEGVETLKEELTEFQRAMNEIYIMMRLDGKDILGNFFNTDLKKLVAVCGKSGSGKSTVMGLAALDLPNINIIKSKTTRAERTEDPEDKYTHTFVSEADWENEKGSAIATYTSPKGYHSWVTPNMILGGVVNLYAIDPVAVENFLIPYCKANLIDLQVVYVDIDENLRKTRIAQRGCDAKGYDAELHLAEHNLKHPHWVVTNNGDVTEAVEVFKDIIREMVGNANND